MSCGARIGRITFTLNDGWCWLLPLWDIEMQSASGGIWPRPAIDLRLSSRLAMALMTRFESVGADVARGWRSRWTMAHSISLITSRISSSTEVLRQASRSCGAGDQWRCRAIQANLKRTDYLLSPEELRNAFSNFVDRYSTHRCVENLGSKLKAAA